ncbi:hypothetical protein Q8F55_008394 [Vanrija albida]|uniref:Zn(2)-C6 fungal-type domain-containing protein n=1 Tax=Vanrija albida TaxID=181172 RepID=A0ABR3PW41_9TREE
MNLPGINGMPHPPLHPISRPSELSAKACDACRIRKIGCDRSTTINGQCTGCTKAAIPCTFTHVRQKSGPAPGSLRKVTSPPTMRSAIPPHTAPPSVPPVPPPGMQDFPIAMFQRSVDAAAAAFDPRASMLDVSMEAGSAAGMTVAALPAQPLQLPTPPMPSTLYPSSNPRPNPLDAILPRHTLEALVKLYFDYVFWLVPYPHRPTFERDLAARREEGDGQEEWTAMVVAVVMYALLHLPKNNVPLSSDEGTDLLERTYNASLEFLGKPFVTYTSSRLYIIYGATSCAYGLGFQNMYRSLQGSNVSMMLQRNLDRESSYATMDPIEGEMMRRMWWLMYGSDRSGGIHEETRLHFNEALCGGLGLPSTMDDEQLYQAATGTPTDDSVPPSPSPLWGFYYCSAMYRVAGKILSRREQDTVVPPTGVALFTRLAELDALIQELDDVFLDMPEFLRLNTDLDTERSPASFPPAATWRQSNNLSLTDHGVMVQQSNLYVTQQAMRLVAVQYRRDLVQMRWQSPTVPWPDNHSAPIYSDEYRAAKLRQNEATFRKARDLVMSNLLKVLRALPIELIAINHFPGLSKIRYVASTLLPDIETASAHQAGVGGMPSGPSMSVMYLRQYIDYLSRLDTMSAIAPLRERVNAAGVGTS